MNLVGIKGVADIIGLTVGTCRVMRATGKLPPPDEMIEGKPLWEPSTIRVWDVGRRKNVAARGPRH